MEFKQYIFLDLALLSQRIFFQVTAVVIQPSKFPLAAVMVLVLASLYFLATCCQLLRFLATTFC